MPALGFSAGKGLASFFGAERVTRRMAGAAMAKALDEIRAAVPLRVTSSRIFAKRASDFKSARSGSADN